MNIFEHSIILVAISSIKWSHPGTLLNHFFGHYKMENRMFGVVLEWFIRICFIYFLFGQVLLYRGHLGSYCRKAVHLVGVAQASTLQHNVGCAMLWCYFIDTVFPCVVWLNFHFIECLFALFFSRFCINMYQHSLIAAV